jgi:hypothetical protein
VRRQPPGRVRPGGRRQPDLPQRCAEAEGPLARARFEDAEVDVLTGEDRHRGVSADDSIEVASGIGRYRRRTHLNDLDHIRRDRGKDLDIDLRSHDAVLRLGDVDQRCGAERCDQEDGGVDAAARSHLILLTG